MSEDDADEAEQTAHDADGGALSEAEVEDLVTYLQLQHCPAPWLEAIEGKQSIEDAAQLAREGGDSEAFIEQSKELFSPLSPLERARMRRALVDRHADARAWSWRTALLAPVAAAAMVLLVLAWPEEPGPTPGAEQHDVVALTARYSLEVIGQERTRSSPDGTGEITDVYEGFELELVAQPNEAVNQAVELEAFAQADGEAMRRLELSVQNQPAGRKLVRVKPEDLGLHPGTWTLVVVVGPRGATSADPAAYADPTVAPDGVQVFRHTLVVHAAVGTTTAIHIETHGCESVGSWPCIVAPGSMFRLWIEDPQARDAEVRIDGLPVETERYGAVTGDASIGAGFRVRIPEIDAEAGDHADRMLVVDLPHGQRDMMLPLRVGRLPAAGRVAPGAWQRMEEHSGAARLAMTLDRWEDALEHRLAQMRLAEDHGCWTRALRAGIAAHYLLSLRLERAPEAERLLGVLSPLLERDPTQRGQLRYAQGIHARRHGQTTLAARHLLEATRLSLGLEDQRLAAGALPEFVRTLIDLGHYAEAERWLRVGVGMSREYEDCPRANMLRSLGESSVLLRELGEPHQAPRVLLEEAQQLYERAAECSASHERSSTRVSLALDMVAAGELVEASRLLDGLDAKGLTAPQRLSIAEARLELALAGDPSSADERLVALTDATAGSPSPEARWRLAMAQARVAEAEGRHVNAVDAYEQAERELDDMVQLWTLGAAHDLFMAQRLASARGLVRLLVGMGDPDRAACVARRARARSLWAAIPAGLDADVQARLDALRGRYLEERAAQDERGRLTTTLPERQQDLEQLRTRRRHEQLADDLQRELELLGVGRRAPHCDELRAPGAAEVIVTVFPLDDDEWAVLTADEHGARGLITDRGLVLDELDEELDRAEQVRVIAAAPANAVPVHTLPWRGRPLMASKTVVHAADLPAEERATAVAEHGEHALLIEDPTGTLTTAARPELDAAARHLTAMGWSVTRLAKGTTSTSHVLEALGEHALLHFAGHGDVEASVSPNWPSLAGGAPGWSTYLDLGNGSRLDVHEVLNARAVPKTVVLSGCKTGVVDARSPAGGMSLAMAFLLAGSERVVASTEPIGNDEVRQVIAELYRSGVLLGPGVVEPSAAPSSAWDKLRVWVR